MKTYFLRYKTTFKPHFSIAYRHYMFCLKYFLYFVLVLDIFKTHHCSSKHLLFHLVLVDKFSVQLLAKK